jgi:predicted nucleic acid-binding protein
VEGLSDSLGRHQVIGIDTSIFIYKFEASPAYVDLATVALDALARGEFRGVTSVLTVMEICVRPLQFGREDAADEYETLLNTFPHLTVVDVTRPVGRRAAVLRAAYRLRPADAVQVASCLELGATAFLTNDKGLTRVSELEVLLLDNFLNSA